MSTPIPAVALAAASGSSGTTAIQGCTRWPGAGRLGSTLPPATRMAATVSFWLTMALTLEAMWLLFAVVQTVSFAFEGLAWMAAGVVAFAAWKLVTTAGFRLAGLGQAQAPAAVRPGSDGAGQTGAPALLLLRVFALGARSERLFDALAWLNAARRGAPTGREIRRGRQPFCTAGSDLHFE